MIVIVVHKDSGTELLKETQWQEEPPRQGDVIELHCGDTSRWKVEEVDWVFEDSPNGLRAARAAGMRAVAVPNHLTRGLPLPEPHLVLDSMAAMTLGEILERV